jgi:hypothetical protein
MPPHIRIRSDFSDGLESKLLRKVCHRRGCRDVYVGYFRRFGFSGARLLLVYFKKQPGGLPFLLKVAEFKKAKDEHIATKILESDVQDARFAVDCVFSAVDSKEKWGALLYEHRGADRPAEAAAPRVLRDLVYDAKLSIGDLRLILTKVFDRLDNAHSNYSLKKRSLTPHFKRYFRNHVARGKICGVLGQDANRNEITFLGARIYNPLKYLNSLPRYANLAVARVHGDLHPDNIVIDRDQIPHLIDFAWAHRSRDVLVDFALLENSVRFMAFAFAGAINLSDQLNVDRALLDENGFKQIRSLNLASPARRKDYARLGCVIGVIRKRARTLLGNQFSMQRYLLTQFILLYGLLRYKDYEIYIGTRALGLIAARLRKIGLPS